MSVVHHGKKRSEMTGKEILEEDMPDLVKHLLGQACKLISWELFECREFFNQEKPTITFSCSLTTQTNIRPAACAESHFLLSATLVSDEHRHNWTLMNDYSLS